MFNVDIPAFGSDKWSFLTSRKVWTAELARAGGSMLSMARSLVKDSKPLPCNAYSPALLLGLVQSTHRYLPAGDHRKLYDKVSTLFVRQHHVHLPYRVPLRVPLLTPTLKRDLKSVLCAAIQGFTAWPVQARLSLECAKTNTVGRLLMSHDLRRLPTDFLEVPPASLCPCTRWLGIPGVGTIFLCLQKRHFWASTHHTC